MSSCLLLSTLRIGLLLRDFNPPDEHGSPLNPRKLCGSLETYKISILCGAWMMIFFLLGCYELSGRLASEEGGGGGGGAFDFWQIGCGVEGLLID